MATGNPRNKCALQPGHSLMDWIRLGNSGVDLAGNRGIPRPITLDELRQHRTADDAWMAVHGKCYNVTRYLAFHPGGRDELMRGVGTDATRLFDELHAWVNYEQILNKCYLGPLRTPGNLASMAAPQSSALSPGSGSVFKLPLQSLAPASTRTSPTRSSLAVAGDAARRTATSGDKSASLPASPTARSTAAAKAAAAANTGGEYLTDALQSLATETMLPEMVPRFDWMQKSGDLMLVFYTRALCNPGWSAECPADDGGDAALAGRRLVVRVFAQRSVHLFQFQLLHAVEWPCTARMSYDTGKIELLLRKSRPQLWTSFGLLDRRKCTDAQAGELPAFAYDVTERTAIAPESWALRLRPRRRLLLHVPIGYHVRIASGDRPDVQRSYTPVPRACLAADGQAGGESELRLLVKRYPGGLLSRALTDEPSAGSAWLVAQPRGSLALYASRLHTRVAMLAAGSGLTPMLSVLEYMLERTSNKIESLTLLYFNKSEADIWCRDYLQRLADADQRLRIVHYLSVAPTPPNWPPAQTGRVSSRIVERLACKSDPVHSTFAFMCGPTAFNAECQRLLAQSAAFDASQLHVFH